MQEASSEHVGSGIGVVIGLWGTGDGKDYTPLVRLLQASPGLQQIDPANAAIVSLVATTTSPNGPTRVCVSALGPCNDLREGVLMSTGLFRIPGVDQQPVAIAGGKLCVDRAAGLSVATLESDSYESYLTAKIKAAESNLLNINTLLDVNGDHNPYRRKVVSWDTDSRTYSIGEDPSHFRKVYDPGSAFADEDGMVLCPNVEETIEKLDLKIAEKELEKLRTSTKR